MKNYLTGVNAKIEFKSQSGFGFPQISLLILVGLTFAGLFYFYVMPHVQKSIESLPESTTLSDAPVTPQTEPQIRHSERSEESTELENKVSETSLGSFGLRPQDDNVPELTLEEELAILEAFEDGSAETNLDLLDDEELIEELTLLDEIEINSAPQSSLPNA